MLIYNLGLKLKIIYIQLSKEINDCFKVHNKMKYQQLQTQKELEDQLDIRLKEQQQHERRRDCNLWKNTKNFFKE